MTNSVSKFTKKELRKLNIRWIWNAQIGWNYERMQGLGYLTTMLPVIDKLYGDRPELRAKALKSHAVFFNTNTIMGNIIVGMNIALEEKTADTGSGIDVGASIKTALMGPLAGIGDTIFGMIAGAVFGSIAATMALEGNPLGWIIWEIWLFSTLFVRFKLFDMGYEQGIKLVTSLSGTMNALTEAASVLGLTVVGGMIATNVKFPLASIKMSMGIDPDTGEEMFNEFNLQSYADSIMPKLFPAIFAVLCYWLLGKKWMNSNKLIIAVVLFSIVLSFFGILA